MSQDEQLDPSQGAVLRAGCGWQITLATNGAGEAAILRESHPAAPTTLAKVTVLATDKLKPEAAILVQAIQEGNRLVLVIRPGRDKTSAV